MIINYKKKIENRLDLKVIAKTKNKNLQRNQQKKISEIYPSLSKEQNYRDFKNIQRNI